MWVIGHGKARRKAHIYFLGRVSLDIVVGQAENPTAIILCFPAAKFAIKTLMRKLKPHFTKIRDPDLGFMYHIVKTQCSQIKLKKNLEPPVTLIKLNLHTSHG